MFTDGTAEHNHIRRHSSYLADTAGELLATLGRVARGLLLSLAVLFGPALILGVALGWLYQRVPLTSLSADSLDHPTPRLGAAVAVVVLAMAAFLLGVFARDKNGRPTGTARLATDCAGLAWIVAGAAVVVPSLAWAASWLLSHTDRAIDVGASVGVVALTYLVPCRRWPGGIGPYSGDGSVSSAGTRPPRRACPCPTVWFGGFSSSSPPECSRCCGCCSSVPPS